MERKLSLRQYTPSIHDPNRGHYLIPRFLVVDLDADDVVAGFYQIEEAIRAYPEALPTAEFVSNDELRIELHAVRLRVNHETVSRET